jgi:hypothetical protein
LVNTGADDVNLHQANARRRPASPPNSTTKCACGSQTDASTSRSNYERPHAALAQAVPASCYQPSPRARPRHLPPLEYPGHFDVRRVSTIGQVAWHGTVIFLSEALAGEQVAFEEVDDGIWTLRFATIALARYDDRQRSLHPIASLSSAGRSASSAGSAPDHQKKC